MMRDHASRLLSRVFTTPRSFTRYLEYCTPVQYRAIIERSQRLRGLRLVEVSSSAHGGEDAQQLQSIVPCLSGLGLDVRWYTLLPDPSFFAVTTRLENLLQGDEGYLTAVDVDLYHRFTVSLADQIDRLDADLLVIHGIPAAGVAREVDRRPRVGVVWRSSLDLGSLNFSALSFMQPFWQVYTSIVLQFPKYQITGLARSRQRFFPGAIDPLALRNQLITRETARQAMARQGIDLHRPVVSMVGSMTANNDPLGVVAAYRLARRQVAGLQLALVATAVSSEDPTVLETTNAVREAAKRDSDIHLYAEPKETGPLSIDAFQTGSEAVVAFARREGFGMTATEAMWKGNAVVGRASGGLSEQIIDGENGFLVQGVEDLSDRLVRLVNDRSLAARLGQQAHQTVADHFLLPRLIDDWLTLFEEISIQSMQRAA